MSIISDQPNSHLINLKSWLKDIKSTWKSLSYTYKSAIVVLLLVLVTIPISVFTVFQQTETRSHAALATPPYITPTLIPIQTIWGSAAKFIFTDKDVISIPANSQKFLINGSFTAELWVKPTNNPWGNSNYPNPYVLCKTQDNWGASNRAPFCLVMSGLDQNNLSASWWIGANNYVYEQPGFGIPLNQWSHLAVSVDAITGTIRNFKNGQLGSINGPIGQLTFNDLNAGTYIGAVYRQISGNYEGFFDGEVDEVRISNNVRYTNSFTPSYTPFSTDANTLALYHLDNNFLDSSGNGNNGQAVGNVQFVQSTLPTPTPIPTPTPTLPPQISASTNQVTTTIVKKFQSLSGLTFGTGFTVTNNGSTVTTWQLLNNQDGTFIPYGTSVTPAPLPVQGFGFYDSSGGIGAESSFPIRSYINNNKAVGTYRGSYTLQEVRGSATLNVTNIKYNLLVIDPPPLVDFSYALYSACQPGTGIPCTYNPFVYQFTNKSSDTDGDSLTYLWNFGDGTTSNQKNPIHRFPAVVNKPISSYLVKLTTDDGHGGVASIVKTIAINVNSGL